MRMIKIFIISLTLLSLSATDAFATPRDVQYHWAATEINTLMENGIMHGYDDGRFKPSRYITREEASMAFTSLAKYQGLSEEALNIADAAGSGNYITREAMASLLCNYFKKVHQIIISGGNKNCPFTDIADSPAREQIIELYKRGFFKGYDDNTFRPGEYVIRGETAVLLFKIASLEPVAPEITLPKYKVIPAPYISQVYPVSAPVGCEATALLMGLHAKGYAMTTGLREFLNDMPRHPSNPAKGFVGSPYKADRTKRTRTTILPGALSAWAAKYGNVADFSGSSPEEIQAELLAGNPVVVYATLWWDKPYYRIYNIEGHYQQMLSNNHAVLVCGYDMKRNIYFIADPYNLKDPKKDLKYWIKGDTFDRIYNERRHAVVVQ